MGIGEIIVGTGELIAEDEVVIGLGGLEFIGMVSGVSSKSSHA